MKNFKKSLFGALIFGLLAVAPAGAATTVGNTTYEQTGVSTCNGRLSVNEEGPAGISGVVTRFAVNPNAAGGSVSFKIVSDAAATTHAIVVKGTSGLIPITTPGLQSYPTRLPVAATDYIGVWGTANFACESQTFLAFTGPSSSLATGSDPQIGFSGNGSPVSNQRTLVSATVEPDADNDGFGDETQDACLGQSGPDGGCAVAAVNPTIVKTCKVPSLKKKTKSAAKKAIEKAGCKLGKTKKKKLKKFTKKQKKNRVRSQSPVAGKAVPAGTSVTITINTKKTKKHK